MESPRRCSTSRFTSAWGTSPGKQGDLWPSGYKSQCIKCVFSLYNIETVGVEQFSVAKEELFNCWSGLNHFKLVFTVHFIWAKKWGYDGSLAISQTRRHRSIFMEVSLGVIGAHDNLEKCRSQYVRAPCVQLISIFTGDWSRKFGLLTSPHFLQLALMATDTDWASIFYSSGPFNKARP